MPFFSVIIPAFNRRELLCRALESVWAQSFTDYEVIVVDDGSTDGTREFLEALKCPIVVLFQPNRGPGAARNLGIKHATGERIAFLDSDDTWFPWTLAVHHEAFVHGGFPAMTAGKNTLVNSGHSCLNSDVLELKWESYGCFFDALNGVTLPIGGTPSITVKRSIMLEAGGFCEDKINGEDTDMWMRLGMKTGFVKILQPPVFAQTIHESNITDDCTLAVAGMKYLFQQERMGHYPGAVYRRKRIETLAASARSVSFHALRCGRRKAALQIYIRSFGWSLVLGRFKYLILFPLLAAGLLKMPSQGVQA